jgi:DNA topoisomerase-1
MDVVVVESPAKAKTINKYLGRNYKVLASFGHVRDLPAKDGSVRPDEDFAMSWSVDGASAKRLADIAKAVKEADGLILATDPDREGEAISWHVLDVLRAKKVLKDKPVSRVVFNAITKQSVLDAMANPRDIDAPLVDAYLARRALDYLVGFTLSPVLWRKLPGARSAGRVQSVALRRGRDRAFRARGVLADRRPARHAARRGFRGQADRLRGQEAPEARHQNASAGRRHQDDAGGRELQGALRRRQADQAQPRPALHHLDLAAGRLVAARLLRLAHHAGGAAAL